MKPGSRINCFTCLLVVGSVLLLTSTLKAEPLIISEFMAVNDVTLADKHGDFTDWIEVHNVTDEPVSAFGWSLTDDMDSLRKWRFPDIEIPARDFVIVFASGKDRSRAEDELHTNFRLSSGGEFLALVKPDGRSITTQFRPRYPPQGGNASYGRDIEVSAESLVFPGQTARVFVPSEDIGLDWVELTFDDAAWDKVLLPVGFDEKEESTFDELIAGDVGAAMLGENSTVYVRLPFTLTQLPDSAARLILRAQYDDSFVVYLNGQELLRSDGAPRLLTHRARTLSERPDHVVREDVFFDLTQAIGELVIGDNLLAVHGLNRAATNPDLLLDFELMTKVAIGVGSATGYIALPTPGSPNVTPSAGLASPPRFSHSSRLFSEPTSLELTTALETATIHYTLDGSEPTRFAPVYSEPIQIDSGVAVRAKVYDDGRVPSASVQRVYALVASSGAAFSSDLPLVVFNSFRRPSRDGGPGHLFVIERAVGGSTRLTDVPSVARNAFFGVRGSSTFDDPKKSWSVEIRDPYGEDLNTPVFGMPPESDWVVYGAHEWDPALLRNVVMYEISRQLGRFAPRTELCEVFVNHIGDGVGTTSYEGVYAFMERIRRGEGRVDIARLLPDEVDESAITGGYMLRIDRPGGNTTAIDAAGQTIQIEYPSGTNISDPQVQWITDFLNDFGAAQQMPDATAPNVPLEEKTYTQFINPDSWVDFHFLNEFSRNPDALGLSTFYFKERGRPIDAGPIWDFDRAVGSRDGRGRDPLTWNGSFGHSWWGPLFSDPVFWELYQSRYRAFRRGPLRRQNLTDIVDREAAKIGSEAAARNFERWGTGFVTEGSWEGEVEFLRDWILRRIDWLDSELLPWVEFTEPGGLVDSGFRFSLELPEALPDFSTALPLPVRTPEGTEIYYTINGPDPRGADDNPVPEAIFYTGEPIEVNENLRIQARAFEGAWGKLSENGYVTSLAPLVVTELMYNPVRPPDTSFVPSAFEFLEFYNAGTEPIEVAGSRTGFTPRAIFTGEDVNGCDLNVLQPGEYAVAVKNLEAFESVYDTSGIKIIGEFEPRNGRLANGGQELIVFGRFGEELLRFRYEGTWYPSANGGGHSIVIVDPHGPASAWSEASGWRQSSQLGGSPGRVDEPLVSQQLPGDFTQDAQLNVADVIGVIRHLFGGTSAPCNSPEANTTLLDTNSDGGLDLSDALYLMRYFFQRGAPPSLGLDCVTIFGCPSACQ